MPRGGERVGAGSPPGKANLEHIKYTRCKLCRCRVKPGEVHTCKPRAPRTVRAWRPMEDAPAGARILLLFDNERIEIGSFGPVFSQYGAQYGAGWGWGTRWDQQFPKGWNLVGWMPLPPARLLEGSAS